MATARRRWLLAVLKSTVTELSVLMVKLQVLVPQCAASPVPPGWMMPGVFGELAMILTAAPSGKLMTHGGVGCGIEPKHNPPALFDSDLAETLPVLVPVMVMVNVAAAAGSASRTLKTTNKHTCRGTRI